MTELPDLPGRIDGIQPIIWRGDRLWLLDQRRLPHEETYLQLTSAQAVADAISNLVVRGAPAIGITAAYGVVLAVAEHGLGSDELDVEFARLRAARPTAVNLAWALERMRALIQEGADLETLLGAADQMLAEDIAANQAMGIAGAEVLAEADEPVGVLTHCNTGSLATGGYGTALGVVRRGWADEVIDRVFASETRPWLQGSRLTAWELRKENIPVQLICDGAGAALMNSGQVQWVITGADRVTANGDVINKIGTLSHAVNARHHGVRMMVVAPMSTLDFGTASGDEVEIEVRSGQEVTHPGGVSSAPADTPTWNPVFDVTPARLIDVLVTERGVVRNPDRESLGVLRESDAGT